MQRFPAGENNRRGERWVDFRRLEGERLGGANCDGSCHSSAVVVVGGFVHESQGLD